MRPFCAKSLAEMVDYTDIPPDTIITCPKCGAKNMRTDNLCRGCEESLDEIKSAISVKLHPPLLDSEQPTMEYVRLKADEANRKGVCISCGASFAKWYGTTESGWCSFCGARMCTTCMNAHGVVIREPMASHMTRFGLQIFQGLMGNPSPFGPPSQAPFYMVKPGYYLCSNCSQFLNGAAFLKHAKEFYEKTGRTEEIAELYEMQGYLDEAKRLRLGVRTSSPPNLNHLIEMLREGGLAVPYKCPSCGANITVDSKSSPEGLKYCSYCGTAVNTDALVKALEANLK